MTDSELFALIKKGDKSAFSIAYENYHKSLYLLAFRYLKDRMLAEDIVQNVFVKLWDSKADIYVETSLKSYLYMMVRNLTLNCIRDNNTAIAHNYRIAQEAEIYDDNLLEMIRKKELMDAFYKAIDLLPEQKKKICLLKMDERKSNQDIADVLSLSVNTVKSHYSQAIKMLRVNMERFLFFIILFYLLGVSIITS